MIVEGLLYGTVIISGTGMIAYGFNKNKEETRSGGWGY
jgi:N-acetylglucosamine kinase-like BadF-type ATPase